MCVESAALVRIQAADRGSLDGVILDAGSSGTRLHVYKWQDRSSELPRLSTAELKKLPEIKTKKKWTKKIHPGPYSAPRLTLDGY